MKTSGQCLCGAIKYEVSGPPAHLCLCHCTQCRQGVGATPVAWATFARQGLALSAGEPAWFSSSPHAKRGFCPACGCSVFFENKNFPDEIDVTVASLDRPDDFAPTMHIWVPSKVAWARTDDGLPCHVRGPNTPPV
jgi:hypothetical protein